MTGSILPLTAAPAEVVPCRDDPEAWDAYPPQSGPARALHLVAVHEAIRRCRTECTQLEACKRYAADHPEVMGVIAGELRPWVTTKHDAEKERRRRT